MILGLMAELEQAQQERDELRAKLAPLNWLVVAWLELVARGKE
jgi:hypothetical protein